MLKCRGVGGETGPSATGQVLVEECLLLQFWSDSNVDPELSSQVGTVANTSWATSTVVLQC
jgi:hypothetical protein